MTEFYAQGVAARPSACFSSSIATHGGHLQIFFGDVCEDIPGIERLLDKAVVILPKSKAVQRVSKLGHGHTRGGRTNVVGLVCYCLPACKRELLEQGHTTRAGARRRQVYLEFGTRDQRMKDVIRKGNTDECGFSMSRSRSARKMSPDGLSIAPIALADAFLREISTTRDWDARTTASARQQGLTAKDWRVRRAS